MQKIEWTPDFEYATHVITTSSAPVVFVTGLAGTGKTTLLRLLLERYKDCSAVVAPTGIAAVHIGGQTIHRFFKLPIACTIEDASLKSTKLQEILKATRFLFVDEVSMVRADLWDCMEARLRLNGPQPGLLYGGVKIICFGDLFQLPPVVKREEKPIFTTLYPTEFFFSGHTLLDDSLEIVELRHLFRHRDPEFIEILNAIRVKNVNARHLERLNTRVDPIFEPPKDSLFITLTPSRKLANDVNEARLAQLSGNPVSFNGFAVGEVSQSDLPTSLCLSLKVGAQVMFVANDGAGRWVNGTLGTVVSLPKANEAPVEVQLEDGNVVTVEPYTWEFYHLTYDPEQKKLMREPVGSFRQLPLQLAWATTIHKSQGLTFERVILDLRGGVFASGQLYVALSRCRTLEGIILRRPVSEEDILVDPRIVTFMKRSLVQQSERYLSLEEKVGLLQAAIGEHRPVTVDYIRNNGLRFHGRILPLSLFHKQGNAPYVTAEVAGYDLLCQLNVCQILDVDGFLREKRTQRLSSTKGFS